MPFKVELRKVRDRHSHVGYKCHACNENAAHYLIFQWPGGHQEVGLCPACQGKIIDLLTEAQTKQEETKEDG